ncbi:hypothetical protein GGR51DRAFT_565724 [Nemania sp. FL0031]|nr:hypothetical protein GGR51DRAFT_565724 [Nemania sp. FL0031]
MPPINGPATAGVIAVSFAVAAAIAIYESPELQRITNDLRRRIAIALHAFGDSITPQERENLFNRPEDAEGFLRSRGLGPDGVPGVVADAESLRRQREEMMYWNAMRESREMARQDEKRHRHRASTKSSTHFDDFLQQDANAEKGAFVFQTGHEPTPHSDGLTRRNRSDNTRDSPRGINSYYSAYTDPFSDEHGIESDIAFENSLIEPGKDEMSDIYSATDIGAYQSSRTMSPEQNPPMSIPLVPYVSGEAEDIPESSHHENVPQPSQEQPQPAPVPSERELGPDEYMTAGQDDRRGNSDVYSSIQAWAQGASRDASFYSPLPASPAPVSEAEFVTDGELTPTDSMSLAGSGVDVADEAVSTRSFDIMSEDSGMHTPSSWTDVESMAGESEAAAGHA